MAFVENGVTYISSAEVRTFAKAAGFGKVGSRIIGSKKVTSPPRAVREIGKIPVYEPRYIVGDQIFYMEKFECEDGESEKGVPLRKIANAGGMGDTISWWSEGGILNVVLNTQMKN